MIQVDTHRWDLADWDLAVSSLTGSRSGCTAVPLLYGPFLPAAASGQPGRYGSAMPAITTVCL